MGEEWLRDMCRGGERKTERERVEKERRMRRRWV